MLPEDCVELLSIYRKTKQENDFEQFVEHVLAKEWTRMHEAHPMSLLHKDLKHPEVVAIIGEQISIPVVDDPFADQEPELGGPKPEVLDVDGEKIEVVNEYHAYCSACRFHIFNSCDPSDAAASFVDHVNSSKHIGCMLLLGDKELSEGLFQVDIPSLGVWLCNACDANVTKMFREKTQTLRECIEEHIGTTEHKESTELFKNESRNLLLTLATAPTLKNLTQFSRYATTAHCKLCNTEYPAPDVYNHIKSKTHLDSLYSKLDTTEPNHKALWNNLKSIAKRFESKPGRLFLNPKLLKASSEDSETDFYVKEILTKSWANFTPHPDTIRSGIFTELAEKFEDRCVRVVNNVHAVCLICRYHIVARIVKNDLATECFKHLSAPEHMWFEGDFPKDKQMLFSGPFCRACEMQVSKWRFSKRPGQLEEAIERHLNYGGHERNERLLGSNKASVLVGLAYTPWMMSFLQQGWCQLCRKRYYDFHEISHCRTDCHLRSLGSFLEGETGLRVTEGVTEDVVYRIVDYFASVDS